MNKQPNRNNNNNLSELKYFAYALQKQFSSNSKPHLDSGKGRVLLIPEKAYVELFMDT